MYGVLRARCTHSKALEYVSLDELKAHAADLQVCETNRLPCVRVASALCYTIISLCMHWQRLAGLPRTLNGACFHAFNDCACVAVATPGVRCQPGLGSQQRHRQRMSTAAHGGEVRLHEYGHMSMATRAARHVAGVAPAQRSPSDRGSARGATQPLVARALELRLCST